VRTFEADGFAHGARFCQADFALELRVAGRIRLALPQPTEWQRIAD